MADHARGKAALIQRGWLTAGGLAVLTLIEYLIAVSVEAPTLWLLPFILAKGGLIMDVFMHAGDLRGGEEGGA